MDSEVRSFATQSPDQHKPDPQSVDGSSQEDNEPLDKDNFSRQQAPEDEPLLQPPLSEEGEEGDSRLTGSTDDGGTRPIQTAEATKSNTYLVLLTFAIGGLQVAWAVELSSISPFLLELGLSKALLAFVWIAGPLSGTLVQPYIGIKSDNCRYKRGRRRPFMIGGAAASIISLLLLSWTREIVGGFLAIFGISSASIGAVVCSQIWAVVLVYVLDFAINVLQAGIRAFIVDCAPMHQQESANAIAGIITGFGGIIGYLFGEVDLSQTLSFLGHSQFQVLCTIACLAMAFTLGVSCVTIKEPDPWTFGSPSQSETGVISFFRTVFASVRHLPVQIKRVCMVQIFAWIGWFPFLFYITTYVGHLYANPRFEANPDMSEKEINEVFKIGTRKGTYALFVYSITSLIASVALPCMVVPTYDGPQKAAVEPMRPGSPASHREYDFHETYGPVQQPPAKLARSRFRDLFSSFSLRVPGLTLRRAWLLSHVLFACLMWLTIFIQSIAAATVLIAIVGISWALTNWAPFALIAAEISKRDAVRRGLRTCPPTEEGHRITQSRAEEPAEQAGIVLGIHNVAVSAPQVISTLVSSVIFKLLQKPRGQPGDDSVGWVLRFGGLCALLAAWFASKVVEGSRNVSP